MATQDPRPRITESEAYKILGMKPRPIRACDIQEAISDPRWQQFRRTLKGRSTTEKLCLLAQWYWHEHYPHFTRRGGWASEPLRHELYYVQVINYVNALKRAGLIVND